jgi:hypothetical protein
MAQRVKVRLVDDLDGGEADETVTFALDGKPREIELSNENAAKFRELLEPYMTASRPAAPDNIAAKGVPAATVPVDADATPPPLTQAQQREEAASIRAWCARHHLPVKPLGRIPLATRKAWLDHTRHNDRTRLDLLLEKANVDPSLPPVEPARVVPINKAVHTVEARHESCARKVGKLSAPQERLLREACAEDGTATAQDTSERRSYEALVRRGVMSYEQADDSFHVTEVGHAWVRLRQPALSA